MEGKSRVVKAETKEGAYGMNKGDKSRTMNGKEDYSTKKGHQGGTWAHSSTLM
jgi:hypothetical protein